MGIQNLVEGFHGTDYSEDTIYRESIDELVLIREKKEFNIKVSRLMNVVINAFTNQNDQEWYQQLRTPIGTIHKLRRQARGEGVSQLPMLLHKLSM